MDHRFYFQCDAFSVFWFRSAVAFGGSIRLYRDLQRVNMDVGVGTLAQQHDSGAFHMACSKQFYIGIGSRHRMQHRWIQLDCRFKRMYHRSFALLP